EGSFATPIESWKRRLKISSESSRAFWSSSSSDRSRHLAGFILSVLKRPRARDELRHDPDLLRGRPERFLRDVLGDAFHLVEDSAGLDHGDPFLGVALALAHPGLRGLLRHRLVREDPDPHLAAALEAARERDARGFDLPVRDPPRLERLETEFSERQLRAAVPL